MRVYYKSGPPGVPQSSVEPIPTGLRMVAGRTPGARPNLHAGWDCMAPMGSRLLYHRAYIPKDCPAGGQIVEEIIFPQCWDGSRLDSPDHRSHMAYATQKAGCPAAYPHPIPSIGYRVTYSIPSDGSVSSWGLSSDDGMNPPGTFVHGDFMDGWIRRIQREFVQRCINDGLSCSGGYLGDGRRLF